MTSTTEGSAWHADTNTFFGTLNVGSGEIPYYPIFWEWYGVTIGSYAKIQYSLDLGGLDENTVEETDTVAAQIFEALGVLENRDDVPTDERSVFFEETIYLEDMDSEDNKTVKRIIPYIPHTKIRVWTYNWDKGWSDGNKGWFSWHHMPWEPWDFYDGQDDWSLACEGNYYTNSSEPCWQLDPNDLDNPIGITFFVKMKDNVQNHKTVSVRHVCSWPEGYPQSLTAETVLVDSMPADFGELLTLQFNTLQITNLCTWCFMAELDYEDMGTINVCNFEVNDDTSCTDVQLHNICYGEETFVFDICKDYCKKDPGNCSDGIEQLCKDKTWDSNFVKDANATDADSIEDTYCGCYLDGAQYDEWYETEVSGKGVYTEEGVGAFDPRCIFGGCSLGGYKFDIWNTCPDVTLCTNNVTVRGDLTLEGSSKLTLSNECGNNPLEDNEVTADEVFELGNDNESVWDQFMALDFLGEYTPYILIGVWWVFLLITTYMLLTG